MTSTETTHARTRYTPGPWDYDMDYIVAADPDGRYPSIYIAEMAHTDQESRIASPEQQDANRRLIAAAPELREALAELLRCYEQMVPRGDVDDNPEEWQEVFRARAALARADHATGEMTTTMKTYRVRVVVRALETYEVEAKSLESAEQDWGCGKLIDSNNEAFQSSVLSVVEV